MDEKDKKKTPVDEELDKLLDDDEKEEYGDEPEMEEDLGDDDMAPEEPVETEEPAKPPEPVFNCSVCNKVSSDVALTFKGGKFYCDEHIPSEAPPPPPPVPEAPKPPEKPWMRGIVFQQFDAVRYTVDKRMLDMVVGEHDEIPLKTGDRLVIHLITADGKKYKCFDKKTENVFALFRFAYLPFVPSTLPPHMRKGNRGGINKLTPPGYG